jgi:hypothetical protein
VIGLARRITNPDGSFGGAVYAPISGQHLMQVFASLDLGPGGSVALYHTGFQLAARFPDIKVGTTTISDQLAAVITSGVESAGFTNLSPVDNVRRTGIARKIAGLPYYVSVALADDDFMAKWQQDRNLLIMFAGLWIGVVLLGMLVLYRTLSNWQQAMGALTLEVSARRRAEAEIRELNQELEHRVAERTAALQSANTELEFFPIPSPMIFARRCARSTGFP